VAELGLRHPGTHRWKLAGAGALLTLSLTCIMAATPIPSAELDERTNRLASELRCLVCQNQTVADSQAELAVQLKREVRSQLAKGATDEQVRDFMVQRYGEFVLYRPTVNHSTWLLWGGPALLLLTGAGLFVSHWRARRLSGNSLDEADSGFDPHAQDQASSAERAQA
jgi:cytochrome c-type biogenesis protein CcmH